MGNILGCVFTPQELHTSTLTGRPSNRSAGKKKKQLDTHDSLLDDDENLSEKNLDIQCEKPEEKDLELPKLNQLEPIKVQACKGEHFFIKYLK